MAEDIERKLIDKRVVQRYLKKGRVDEKEYERHVRSLPDLADAAVPIESNLEPDEADLAAASAPSTTPGAEAPKEG